MIRIAGITLDCNVRYRAGDSGAEAEINVPSRITLTDEQIIAIKNAEIIEEIDNKYGKAGDVIGTYSLVGWRSVEKTDDGIWFTWQTYRTTDLEQLRQENEDLTQALLELAEIVGGSNG